MALQSFVPPPGPGEHSEHGKTANKKQEQSSQDEVTPGFELGHGQILAAVRMNGPGKNSSYVTGGERAICTDGVGVHTALYMANGFTQSTMGVSSPRGASLSCTAPVLETPLAMEECEATVSHTVSDWVIVAMTSRLGLATIPGHRSWLSNLNPRVVGVMFLLSCCAE